MIVRSKWFVKLSYKERIVKLQQLALLERLKWRQENGEIRSCCIFIYINKNYGEMHSMTEIFNHELLRLHITLCSGFHGLVMKSTFIEMFN